MRRTLATYGCLRFLRSRVANPFPRPQHFDFGRSITLSQNSLYHLLSALLTSHSSAHETFLIFHDPRGDMRSLAQLGFDPPADFRTDLRQLGAPSEKGDAHGNIWVVDTQRLFSAWTGRKAQVGLEKACRELEVPTRRLHNAGNDAHCPSSCSVRMSQAGADNDPHAQTRSTFSSVSWTAAASPHRLRLF